MQFYIQNLPTVTGEEVKILVGLSPSIFKIFAEAYGFTYELFPSEVMDLTHPNGTREGVIPQVRANRCATRSFKLGK